MSWGLAGWGLTPWGGIGGMSISSAIALATHTVRVTLSSPPLATTVARIGDALNPATWSVARSDTGEAFAVRLVVPVSGSLSQFELSLAAPLGPHQISHTVAAPGLLDALGNLIGPTSSTTFLGTIGRDVVSAAARATARGHGLRDLKSFASPRNPAGGTLVVQSDGDYGTVSGTEMLRRLLYRRLVSMPGDFFHLPNYGVGLKVKEPVRASSLAILAREIEGQLQREPEVKTVRVNLGLLPENVLMVMAKVQLRSGGQQTDLSFQIPVGAVVL